MNNLYNKIYEAINAGIQKALIISDKLIDDVSIKWYEKEKTTTFIPYEYRTVDMGTDILWCEYNLGAFPGAKAKNWYGDYYAWGETTTKNDYSWENYKYCHSHIRHGAYDKLTLKKYLMDSEYGKSDNKAYLESADDIIQETLGNNFRMPTDEEFNKLLNNTTNEWVKNYKGIHGLNGRLFTSKSNGNTLFFPAAGIFSGSSIKRTDSKGGIWTNSVSPYSSANAWFFDIDSANIRMLHRYYGYSIRGVQEFFI